MTRALGIFLLIFSMSCSKHDVAEQFFPLEENALSLASTKCQSTDQMEWLRAIIRKSESDAQYKGNIYAIQYTKGTAFLQQPWLSSCFGCLVYDCDGHKLVAAGSELDEIISGAKEENVIYTSTN
jgi:hypothetical protein